MIIYYLSYCCFFGLHGRASHCGEPGLTLSNLWEKTGRLKKYPIKKRLREMQTLRAGCSKA